MGNSMNCILLTSSDWISIAGILVELLLAVWIIKKIEEKSASKRALKDLLISEIKDIREDYRLFFSELINDDLDVKLIIPNFKSRNIRNTNLLQLLKQQKYITSESVLNTYMFDLLQIITDSDDFAESLRSGGKLKVSKELINEINKFRSNNVKIFSDLIISVNNGK